MSESKRSNSDMKSPAEPPVGPSESSPPHSVGLGGHYVPPEATLTSEDQKHVDGCILALVELLVTFGLRRPKDDSRVYLSIRKTRLHWYSNCAKLGTGGWMKWAKFKFAAFNAYWVDNPIPPNPIPGSDDKPHLLACGVIQSYINRIMRASDISNGRVRDSILQGMERTFNASVGQLKRGCPRPTEAMVEQQVEKTCVALTTARPVPPDSKLLCPLHADEVTEENKYKPFDQQVPRDLNRNQLERQLRRTVREVFSRTTGPRRHRQHQKIIYNNSYRLSPKFPTTKATYSHGRSKGGGVAALYEFLQGVRYDQPNPERDVDNYIELTKLLEYKGNEASIIIGYLGEEKRDLLDIERGEVHNIRDILREYADEDVNLAAPPYVHNPNAWADYEDRLDLLGEIPEFLGDIHRDQYVRGVLEGQLNRLFTRPSVEANVQELEAVYGRLYWSAIEEAIRRIEDGVGRLVKPVGLAESLKIRVITKGDAILTFALKPLQTFMWSTLASHPVFSLVGKPVNGFVLQDQLGALRENEEFISGDYSAATDNLDPFVSDVVADEIATWCQLTTSERQMFHTALTGHIIEFPDGRRVRQVWGQLMGSVVSFPVLCIANAAMSRWAYELSINREVKLHRCPMLINGDDILLKGLTEITRYYWELTTAYAGLQTSLGKTYYSSQMAQINSENFYYEEVPTPTIFINKMGEEKVRDLHYITTPFVNLGLLMGLKRSGELDGSASAADPVRSLGSRARDLLRKCHPHPWHRQRVYELYMKYNSSKLKDLRGRVPWHMPESWGGLGLPCLNPPEGSSDPFTQVSLKKIGPSDEDLRVAARLRERPDLYPVGVLPADVSWETHRYVMKKYSRNIIHGYPTPLQDWRWSQLYRMSVVEQFFLRGDELLSDVRLAHKGLSENAINKIKTKQQVRTNMNVLRRNEKSWKTALHEASIKFNGLPPPLSYETVLQSNPPVPFLDVGLTSDTLSLEREFVSTAGTSDQFVMPMDPWFYEHQEPNW